jgi:hypothetical protein
MDPIVLRPGEGEKLDIAGNELIFKARPEETGGAYVLTDYTAGPGLRPTDPAIVAEIAQKYDIESA